MIELTLDTELSDSIPFSASEFCVFVSLLGPEGLYAKSHHMIRDNLSLLGGISSELIHYFLIYFHTPTRRRISNTLQRKRFYIFLEGIDCCSVVGAALV
jgi:hypothetical protein